MPKFKVDITRIGYGHATVEIDAEDLFDAREIAQNTAGNYSYSEKSADYEIGTTSEIKDERPLYKMTMFMHMEGPMGDIEYQKLDTSTLDPQETCKAAAALYELVPNMVCIMVYDVFGHLHFEQKVEHYVSDVLFK